MPVNYDALLSARVEDEPLSYSETDTILYALAAGFGHDAHAGAELHYVYEGRALNTVPTMAGNLFNLDFLADCGWATRHVAIAEQNLHLYRPLPSSAELHADRRVVAAIDHGKGLGASVTVKSDVCMAKDQAVLFTLTTTLFARDDGGFGGPRGSVPPPHKLPGREADLACELPTHPQQALMFRLTGDRNAVYADARVASQYGYSAPPLQELCVAAIACRAVMKTICEYDFTLVAGFDLRFTAPVYPGDRLTTEMWQDRNVVSFRCTVAERNSVVVDNGKCTLAA